MGTSIPQVLPQAFDGGKAREALDIRRFSKMFPAKSANLKLNCNIISNYKNTTSSAYHCTLFHRLILIALEMQNVSQHLRIPRLS